MLLAVPTIVLAQCQLCICNDVIRNTGDLMLSLTCRACKSQPLLAKSHPQQGEPGRDCALMSRCSAKQSCSAVLIIELETAACILNVDLHPASSHVDMLISGICAVMQALLSSLRIVMQSSRPSYTCHAELTRICPSSCSVSFHVSIPQQLNLVLTHPRTSSLQVETWHH